MSDILVVGVVPDELVESLKNSHNVSDRRGPSLPDLSGDVRRDATILISSWQVGFDDALLSALPCVRLVLVYGTGSQALDLESAHRRAIRVCNTWDDGTDCAVAEFGIAASLALSHNLVGLDRWVRQGKWLSSAPQPTRQLHGHRMGIIGLGYVGRALGTKATALGMQVAYTEPQAMAGVPYAYFNSPVQLAAESDYLVVCCRGGPEVDGLVNHAVLTALGPNGYLIHLAQARFYVEADLLTALSRGEIAGAAIDIFHGEPAINPGFFELPNVLLSPHVAALTETVLLARARIVKENIERLEAGRALLCEL
jgi:hydroxypyruvate reductase